MAFPGPLILTQSRMLRARVFSGSDPHNSFEIAGEMALIGKTNAGGHLHARHTTVEQRAGALHAELNQVRVRRKPKFLSKNTR